MMATISAYGFAALFFGIPLATALFISLYLKRRGRGFVVSIITGVITTTGLYAIFKFGLDLDLYSGLIWHWMNRGKY